MSDVDRSATTFRVNADSSQAEKDLQRFKSAVVDLSSNIERLNTRLASSASPRFANNVRKQTRELSRFASTAKSGFGALAAFNTFTATTSGLLSGAFAFAVINATTNLVKLGATAESTRVRFLALSESITDGRRRYQEFADFADDRGLEFRGLAEAANQLRVVGFAGEDLDQLITQIGIIAGDSTEKVQRITRALGQMRAFGRVALEELNQLTEAGVPIVTALAEELQVPEGNVRGLIELGKIDFQDVRNSITALASETSAFFIASEAQSETLQASINRLNNSFFFFADTVNEDISPALIGILETTADVIKFFTSTQGAIVGVSAVLVGTFIPALGLSLLALGRFLETRRSVDPMIIRFQLLNRQIRHSIANVGILRRVMIGLGVAMRAIFSPLGLGIAFVGIPAIIALTDHFIKAREEAEQLEEAIKGAQNATGDGIITFEEAPDQFRLINREIREIEHELDSVNRRGERLQRRWVETRDLIAETTDETRKLALETRRADIDAALSVASERAQELVLRLQAAQRAIGDYPALATPLSEVILPDEERIRIQRETDLLASGIRETIEEEVANFNQLLTFAPELREKEIRRITGLILEQKQLVAEFARSGLFFFPEGSTVRFLNEQLEVFSNMLDEIKGKNPFEDYEKLIQANVNALLSLEAGIDVGLIDASERLDRTININRTSLRDLLVLQERLRSSGADIPQELFNQIEQSVTRLRLLINESTSQKVTILDVFESVADAGITPSSLKQRYSKDLLFVFNAIRDGVQPFKRMIQREFDEILNSVQTTQQISILDENFQDLSSGGIQSYINSLDQANLSADEHRFIVASVNSPLRVMLQNYVDLTDAIEFNSNGVTAWVKTLENGDKVLITINQNLRETQQEVFSLERAFNRITQADPFGDAGTIFREALRVQQPALEIRAFADAFITLGESIITAERIYRNLIDGIAEGDLLFRIFGRPSNVQGYISGFFDLIADLVEVVELPFTRIDTAIKLTDDNYKRFVQDLAALDPTVRESVFSELDRKTRERFRQELILYERVYSRVGQNISASLFDLLPRRFQQLLEDAYQATATQVPALLGAANRLEDIFNDDRLLLSERIRQTGQAFSDLVTATVGEFGEHATNILTNVFDLTNGNVRAWGIFRDVIGGTAHVLGLETDRVLGVLDGLARIITGVEIPAEVAVTKELTAGLLQLTNALQLVQGNLFDQEKAYLRSAIAANVFRQETGKVIETTGELRYSIASVNSPLQITSGIAQQANESVRTLADEGLSNLRDVVTPLNIELAALAPTIVDVIRAMATGESISLLSLVPGVIGLIFDQTNNLVNATIDYVSLQRTLGDIPAEIAEAGAAQFQEGLRRLQQYRQEVAEFSRLRIDFEPIHPDRFTALLDQAAPQIALIQTYLEDEAFQAFINARGIVVETVGDAREAILEFYDSTRSANEQLLTSVTSVANTLAQTIGNGLRNEIILMERELENLREINREALDETNNSFDRQQDILRDRLQADLISVIAYYDELDKLNDSRKMAIDEIRQAEIEKENAISLKRWEAEVQAFRTQQAVAIANIAISAAEAYAKTYGLLGPFGIGTAEIIAGLALAQVALVAAQQPPPRPDVGLQSGGVVNRPTRALIGEGSSAEAVIPLDRYEYRKRGEGNQGTTIIVNVAGSVVTERELAEKLATVTRRLGKQGRIRIN